MEAISPQGPSATGTFRANALFSGSLDPMLLVDDDRRCASANAAACLFLRRPIDVVCKLTIDALIVSLKPATHNVLTRRERDVLTLVALGNTGVQIAEQLFLSPATVQTHVASALLQLGARNRAHAITLALQTHDQNARVTRSTRPSALEGGRS